MEARAQKVELERATLEGELVYAETTGRAWGIRLLAIPSPERLVRVLRTGESPRPGPFRGAAKATGQLDAKAGNPKL